MLGPGVFPLVELADYRGMRNEVQKFQGKGAGFFTRRAISNYLKIVSSGASNVASTVRQAGASVASSITEKEDSSGCDQVYFSLCSNCGERRKSKFFMFLLIFKISDLASVSRNLKLALIILGLGVERELKL